MALQLKKILPFVLLAFFVPFFAHASIIGKPGNNLGLVGYWSFNEGTSTKAYDYSGNGNKGTLSGSTLPAWTSGKLGKALSFGGSGYIQTANNSGYTSSSQPLTISLWIKPSDNGSAGPVLLTTALDSAPFDGIWLVYGPAFGSGTTNSVIFGEEDPSTHDFYAYTTNGSVPTNTWTHVVEVYDGSGGVSGVSIYLNGVAMSLTTHTNSLSTFTNRPWNIGASLTPDSFLGGKLDDVRIYNRALSASEVAALYQSGSARTNTSQSPGTLSSGLVAWWTMDGGDTLWTSAAAGNEIDKSGNGNTGALTSFVASTKQAIGKIGQALYFSSGWMDVASSTTISPNNQITIGFWIKGTPSSSAYIQYLYNENSGVTKGWQIQQNNLGTDIYLRVDTSAGSGQAFGNVVVLDGNWHYVVYTLNQGAYAYYKDGVPAGSGSYSHGGGFSSFNDLKINPSVNLRSSLDDVRIYNRALSASEVKQLYNLGAGSHTNTSSANLQAGSSLASGLVGLWTFDGSTISGSSISDLSGQGNTATDHGATPTIGKLGQGMQFDGVSNYIDTGITTESGLFSNTTFTLSAWIKNVPDDMMFAKWGFSQGFYVIPDFVQLKAFNYGRGSDGVINVNDGNWHLITDVITTDTSVPGNNNVDIYQDGVLHNGTASITGGGAYTPATGHPLTIGSRQETGHQTYFTGTIDDARVYNRALSASEIKQLYLMGR